MKIAIVDDDLYFQADFMKRLEMCLLPEDVVFPFNSGVDFIHECENHIQFDLVFMDVELGYENGVSVTKELKELSPGTIVIMLTRFKQFAIPAFHARAHNYYLKPLETDIIKSILNEVRCTYYRHVDDFLVIQTQNVIKRIPLIEIVYIESYGRKLNIVTLATSYQYYKKISELNQELEGKGFYRIHKSFLINLHYIDTIDRTNTLVKLVSGKKIPVGDRNLNKLKEVLINYRGNQ